MTARVEIWMPPSEHIYTVKVKGIWYLVGFTYASYTELAAYAHQRDIKLKYVQETPQQIKDFCKVNGSSREDMHKLMPRWTPEIGL